MKVKKILKMILLIKRKSPNTAIKIKIKITITIISLLIFNKKLMKLYVKPNKKKN
jgi:hypothetical protein